MNPDNNDIGLSRRKVLVGLGAVGVASAGAGLGTTAYFSDEESFGDNTLTAGTLELLVEQKVVRVNQDGIGPDQLNYFSADDDSGEAVVTEEILIEDAKPGDEYEFCWDVEIDGNPGFAKVVVPGFTDENGVEAENVSLDDLHDVDEESELTTIGEAADATATLTLADDSEVIIYENSLAGLLVALADGIPVPSEVVADGPDEFCHEPNAAVELCVVLEIPTDVGNELQGASATFEIEFCAEQCRHNDVGSFLGQEVETSVDEGFVDVAGEFDQKTMNARGRYGSFGNWALGLADDLGSPAVQANYAWGDGDTVPFSFVYDGDDATFTVDGVSITDDLGEPQGQMGFTVKADDATIDIDDLVVVANNGAPLALNGPDAVTATNDGDGRALRHLLVNTDASQLAGGFEMYGEVTVTLGPDFAPSGGGEEVAFDIVVE